MWQGRGWEGRVQVQCFELSSAPHSRVCCPGYAQMQRADLHRLRQTPQVQHTQNGPSAPRTPAEPSPAHPQPPIDQLLWVTEHTDCLVGPVSLKTHRACRVEALFSAQGSTSRSFLSGT